MNPAVTDHCDADRHRDCTSPSCLCGCHVLMVPDPHGWEPST